jgi:outer membrane protein TolC
MNRTLIAAALAAALSAANAADRSWPDKSLTMNDCLAIALQQNPAILKGKQDVEESQGVALQQRSVYLPKVNASGAYNKIDPGKIESVSIPGQPPFSFQTDQNWNAGINVSQPIYSGGKLTSSHRQSRLTREAALAGYQALVADTLLSVRIAYEDVLVAAEQIIVQEASVKLLEQELTDNKRRFDAGTVPRFNVLRAEVELANSKPKLIKARNDYRIAKSNLANLLGFDVPKSASEDIPLSTADQLKAEPFDAQLGPALGKALQQRQELTALRANEKNAAEDVVQAKSSYYPGLSGVAGWGWQNRIFDPSHDLSHDIGGWNVGAQLTWDVFDFGATKGKVDVARARREKARIDVEDTQRKIELEVRTAYSNFIEAKETLESQSKVIEQAEEALRLANARAEAGTGTQLDVLSAQTDLTQTRTTYSQALHDYAVAKARFDRAVGDGVIVTKTP